jgi:Tol biopolymer transport system component
MGWRFGFGRGAALGLVAIVAGASPALAAFPGENGKLAFLRVPPTAYENAGSASEVAVGDLYVMEPDGRRQRRVLRGVADASFSADGRRLALVTESARGSAVTVADADGRARRVLTRRGDLLWAELSPDGRRIVFARRSGDRYGLHAVGVDGSGGRRIALLRATLRGGVGWSPEGERVVVATTTERALRVISVALDGRGVSRIRTFRPSPASLGVWGTSTSHHRVTGWRFRC